MLYLEGKPEGSTWKELVFHFPRKTLARHLKTLLNEGQIERIVESSDHRCRGRLSTRYRARGRLVMEIPVKRISKRWFPAMPIRGGFGRKDSLRLSSEDSKEYKTLLAKKNK
jgi:hypothetical protein